jgi:hypothetical protein
VVAKAKTAPPPPPTPTDPAPTDPNNPTAPSLPDSHTAAPLSTGELVTVPINSIKPYWRNPRRVTEDAVNQLVRSITDYGYQQPIVTDRDRVIIVGHTRYAALRRMGVTEVPIRIDTTLTAEQVKQYRLIDNKVGELTFWDYESLMAEVQDMDQSLIHSFFPEIDTDAPIFDTDQATMTHEWDRVETGVGFTCPSCYHSWEVEVTRDDLQAGLIPAPTAKEDTA